PLSDPNGAAPLRRADKGNRAAVVEIKADRYTVDVLPIVEDIRANGAATLLAIATELNERQILTAAGGTSCAREQHVKCGANPRVGCCGDGISALIAFSAPLRSSALDALRVRQN